MNSPMDDRVIQKQLSLSPMTIMGPTLFRDLRRLALIGSVGGAMTWIAFDSGSPGVATLGGGLLFPFTTLVLSKALVFKKYRHPQPLTRTFTRTGFSTGLPGIDTHIAWWNLRPRSSTRSYYVFEVRTTGQLLRWKKSDFDEAEWQQIDAWQRAANPPTPVA